MRKNKGSFTQKQEREVPKPHGLTVEAPGRKMERELGIFWDPFPAVLRVATRDAVVL
jgi:hypothetical protein